jgi:uncharacterized protein YndB with AHSA1/START domain
MMEQAPAQVYQVFIRATPDQVWDAITKPEFIEKYFFGSKTKTSGRPGARIQSYGPDGTTLWRDDQIIESEPPHRLVYSWRSLYDAELAKEGPSRVTWEIEPQPGGITKLTVTHDQLESSPKTAKSVSGGWMFILSGLKTLLETGEPLSPRSLGEAPRG